MTARTERRLDGYKLFAHIEGDAVVVHAVTDGRPVTRLVHVLSAEDARDFASCLVDAAEAVETQSAVHGANTDTPQRDFGPKESP